MKVLVTGGTGFIGRRFVARLVASGLHEPVCIVRRTGDILAGARSIVATDPSIASFADHVAAEAPDAIVHLAAAGVHPGDRDIARLTEVNAALPPLLVQAAEASGTGVVLVAGTSAEYAAQRSAHPIVEDTPLESTKLYGATKAAGGLVALATGRALGVRVAVMRLFNIFGAGEAPHRLLPSIMGARAGQQVAMSTGSQVRDFIEVDDACLALESALTALAERRLATGHYNVCSGVGTTVAEFAQMAIARLGCDPSLLKLGTAPLRPDDLPWLVGDPTRLRDAIGWTARPLERAIAHALREFDLGIAAGAPDGRERPPSATSTATASLRHTRP